MRRLLLTAALAAAPLVAGAASVDIEVLTRQVTETERAFARSMAERNHAAFTALVSEQAVFIGGPQPLRGKAAVAFLLDQLTLTPDDKTVSDVLLIFEAMARLKTYSVRADIALMTTLTSRVSGMKDSFWRAEATRTLENIKQLSS